jgi:biopolymer transport protein ExbD
MRLVLLILVPLAACGDQATQDPAPSDRGLPEASSKDQGPTMEELEGLKLPGSVTAIADEPGRNDFRPAIRIMQDGSIWSDNSHALGRFPEASWPAKVDLQLHGQADSNGLEAVGNYLARMARLMELRTLGGELPPSKLENLTSLFEGIGTEELVTEEVEAPEVVEFAQTNLKNDPLLIRADEFSPFKYTQKIMEQCCAQNVQIWKLQLATADEKLLRVYLPKDFALWDEEIRQVSIVIEVTNEGTKLDEKGTRAYDPAQDLRFTYDSTRQLSYQVTSGWFSEEPVLMDVEIGEDGEVVTLVEGGESTSDEDERISTLTALREQLQELKRANEGAQVLIDARPGTVTQDVVDVFDAVLTTGFEQITFAGSME